MAGKLGVSSYSKNFKLSKEDQSCIAFKLTILTIYLGVSATTPTHTIRAFHRMCVSVLRICIQHDGWPLCILSILPLPQERSQGKGRVNENQIDNDAVSSGLRFY